MLLVMIRGMKKKLSRLLNIVVIFARVRLIAIGEVTALHYKFVI